MRQLDGSSVQALRHAVEGGTLDTFHDDHLTVVFEALPGRAVVGVSRQADQMWVIVDRSKPGVCGHLLALIDSWPTDDIANRNLLPRPFPAPRRSGSRPFRWQYEAVSGLAASATPPGQPT